MAPTKNIGGKQVVPTKSKSARRSIGNEKNKLKQSAVAHRARSSLRLEQRSVDVKTEVKCKHPTVNQENTTNTGAKLGTQEVKNDDTKTEVTKPEKKQRLYKVSKPASKPATKVPAKQSSQEKPRGPITFKSLDIEEAMHEFANTKLGGDLGKAVEDTLLVAQHAGRKTIQLGDVQLARMFVRGGWNNQFAILYGI